MLEIVRQTAELREQNVGVVLVSSGAVAAGREVLQREVPEKVLPSKQMLASVGQIHLMELWRDLFAIFQIHVGQMLLTRSDFANRQRYLNVRDTLLTLLHQGMIPVINENDAIVMTENRVGDNDNLSALIANMIAAELLVLLTDQKGLYNANPQQDPTAQLIQEVPHIDAEIWRCAGGSLSSQGTGGMATKIQAAVLATQSGTPTAIATLQHTDVLLALWRHEKVGTLFHATASLRESRKRWLLAEKPQGCILIDTGAVQRLCGHGASLLPVGIVGVEGSFERGANVQLLSPQQQIVCLGLSNYSSKDIQQIAGLKSEQIAERLGYTYGHEVVHRDNMAVI
jgi:glutamate 5-kinase